MLSARAVWVVSQRSRLGDSALGLWEFSLLFLQLFSQYSVISSLRVKEGERPGMGRSRGGKGAPEAGGAAGSPGWAAARQCCSTAAATTRGEDAPSLPEQKGCRFLPFERVAPPARVSGPLHAGDAAGPEEQRRAEDPRLRPRARGEAAEAAERPGEPAPLLPGGPPPSLGAPPPPWGTCPSSLRAPPPPWGAHPPPWEPSFLPEERAPPPSYGPPSPPWGAPPSPWGALLSAPMLPSCTIP